MDGMALLDLLKRSSDTRHIPVHVISADDQRGLGLAMGAYGFTSKPVEREVVVSKLEEVKDFVARPERRVVLVGKEGEIARTLEEGVKQVDVAADLSAALDRGPAARADCIVVDASAVQAGKLVDQLKRIETPIAPVVVYAGQELQADDERLLRLGVFTGLLRLARTSEQLLDEVTLCLHEPEARLPAQAKAKLARTRQEDQLLRGRKVVVIDDEIRNIFSLASALENFGIELRYAESGRAGIDLLRETPDADVVLVDIMMPGMDGYETIHEIRSMPPFVDLPIVAVTAKAMKGDRQKCIQAGASDYVSKPVDIDHLAAVLRVAVQRTDRSRALAGEVAPMPVAG
jgi:CheY-like chemotaxis protein